jgi:hypothetical protein
MNACDQRRIVVPALAGIWGRMGREWRRGFQSRVNPVRQYVPLGLRSAIALQKSVLGLTDEC